MTISLENLWDSYQQVRSTCKEGRKEGRKHRPFFGGRPHLKATYRSKLIRKQKETVVEMNRIFDFTTFCVTMRDLAITSAVCHNVNNLIIYSDGSSLIFSPHTFALQVWWTLPEKIVLILAAFRSRCTLLPRYGNPLHQFYITTRMPYVVRKGTSKNSEWPTLSY
jgi:hypothetical protein